MSYEVNIEVNGVSVPEYQSPTRPQALHPRGHPIYENYVEIAEDQEFAISIIFHADVEWPTGTKNIEVYFDGTFVTGRLVNQNKNQGTSKALRLRGADFGFNATQPFTFGRLEVSSDGSTLDTFERTAKLLGDIRVTIYDCIPQQIPDTAIVDHSEIIQEPVPRELIEHKFLDLKAGLSPAKIRDRRAFEWLDPGNGVRIADYIFKYRSSKALESLGIMREIDDTDELLDCDSLESLETTTITDDAWYIDHQDQKQPVFAAGSTPEPLPDLDDLLPIRQIADKPARRIVDSCYFCGGENALITKKKSEKGRKTMFQDLSRKWKVNKTGVRRGANPENGLSYIRECVNKY